MIGVRSSAVVRAEPIFDPAPRAPASVKGRKPVSYVTHLEAAIDGTHLPHNELQTLHEGRPLWVRYDLEAVAAAMTPEAVAGRAPTMWRYKELLPVEDESKIASLGEGMTPLLKCERLGAELGLNDLWVKDESQLPTGSFKSRGLAVAISRANELGVKRVAIPTAGNAGGAMAAYAARVGMEAFVFMPADTPIVNQHEAAYYGARAYLVDGLITDCGAVVREGTAEMGWFDMSTLKEPYRIEGKKTMGLELAEQFDWSLPDVILYPTGGGTGLIGMWKAFAELAEIGWLADKRRPRMISCQSDGCAPISTAWAAGRAVRRSVSKRGHRSERAAGAGRGRRLHDHRRRQRVRRPSPSMSGTITPLMGSAGRRSGRHRLCPRGRCLSGGARVARRREGNPPRRAGRGIQYRRGAEVCRGHRVRPPVPSISDRGAGHVDGDSRCESGRALLRWRFPSITRHRRGRQPAFGC